MIELIEGLAIGGAIGVVLVAALVVIIVVAVQFIPEETK